MFLSPKLLGGFSASTPLSDLGFTSMDQALKIKEISTFKIEEDLVLNMLL